MAGVHHLVLHHLIPADDPTIGEADWRAAVAPIWPGRLSIWRDGMVISIP
jgi:ribonuclease BN (tRNA processing enzyme)